MRAAAILVAASSIACRHHAANPTGDRAPRAPAAGGAARWDWNGIVGTGQSLSVGAEARRATLTGQPFHNLKLSLGTAAFSTPPFDPNDSALSVVPLVEPIRPEATGYPNAYPMNIYGETPHTAMADEISALNRDEGRGDYTSVHVVVGESGQGIDVIDKTAVWKEHEGHAYAATIFEVSALERLATAAGKTFGVHAVVLTHGETDGLNEDYGRRVVRLLDDYDADIRAITRQTESLQLLLTQQQTCPGDAKPVSTLIEWRLGVDHPDRIVCVGPKYQYPYAPDGVHLVAEGYDRLGEKYGEVFYERVVLGHFWQPLQPIAVRRDGATIIVRFHVPDPPLTWDDALPAPHHTGHTAWANGRGFEVENDDGELTIDSVSIRGDSVAIALAALPRPAHLVVRYALTQDESGMRGGRATGRIGQLCDSDPFVGYATGVRQPNYAVSFEMPVP